MKNKGFTLLELLVVIAIMGVLGIIITASLSSTLNKTNQEDCDEFVKEVEEGACVYADLSRREFPCNRPGCEIPLSILYQDGMIEENKDACTGKELNFNATVTVTWDAVTGKKECVYNGVRVYER